MTSPAKPTDPPGDPARATRLAAADDSLAAGRPPAVAGADADDLALLHLLDRLRPSHAATALDAAADPAAEPQARDRYVVRGLYAEGGIGQVWLALDTDLGRDVALKVLRPEREGDPALAGRFLHEARVTARLQHPGIVPVYDLAPGADGSGDEPPFYTMRLVQGRTLTEAIRAYHDRRAAGRATAVERATLLNAFVGVCNAVAYAHSQGVLHRDLKPDNVALGDYGEVVVLDWGFAKERAGDGDRCGSPSCAAGGAPPAGGSPRAGGGPGPRGAQLRGAPGPPPAPHPDGAAYQSAAGQVLGTPAYMAPEQAAGGAVDERADVYGLGAILYELLTGRPPFQGDDAADVLRQVRSGPPPRPRAVAPRVPPALQAVCLKALAREPADRYPSAAAVARDVQHWLADEPVAAYAEPLPARVRRAGRRHPAVVAAGLALLTAAGVAAGLVESAVSREQARSAEARAAAATEHANAMRRAQADQQVRMYLHRIALAERTLAAHNPSRTVELLAECPVGLRDWEWHCLNRLCRGEARHLRGHTGTVQAVAFSRDGATLATAGFDGTVRLWDAAGRARGVLTGHGAVVYDLAFSPDGRHLATAGWDGAVRLWDYAAGRVVHTLTGPAGHVNAVVYAPDGGAVYALADDAVIRVWDTATGRPRRALTPARAPSSLDVSPDGRLLAFGGSDAVVRLVDAETGAEVGRLAGHRNTVRAVAFSPDGSLLATGDGDIGRGDAGEVKVWNWAVAGGRELHSFRGHTAPVSRVAFAPQGTRLASAGMDAAVKIWDLVSGQEALTLHAHTDAVRAAAFSPDGQRLATAGADRVVRVWDASPADGAPPRQVRVLAAHAGRALGVAFRPDGGALATVGAGHAVRLWGPGGEGPTGEVRLDRFDDALLKAPNADYFAVAYTADGARLVTANSAGTVAALDPATGRLAWATASGHAPGPVRGVAVRPGGRHVATGSWDRTVGVWDLATGRRALVLAGHAEPVNAVAYDPRGRWLASAGNDQSVRVWDADAGRELRVLTGHTSGVLGVAVAPDGTTLASASNDGAVRLWDTATWRERTALRGHTSGVRAVAFSPDGRLLASAGDDWTVRVWRAADGDELAVLRGHADAVHGLAFRPDGRVLASAGYDGTVRLWDVADLGD